MMRKAALFALAALAAALSCPPAWSQAPAADDYEARLTSVKGEVTVIIADDPDGVPGVAEVPLVAGDRIKTGADGVAEVTFSGQHCVYLRPQSELTITSVQKGGCVLALAVGSLLAKIQALTGGTFQVSTPEAVAAVRGTEFGVEVPADNPGQSHVGVFDEGKVEVSGRTGAPELLQSNQETMVARGSRPLAAYQLKRFARHRQFMRAWRKRVAAVRKAWRSLSAQQRQQKRGQLLQRMRQMRQQRFQKIKQRKLRTQQSLQGRRNALQQRERLKKLKQGIRNKKPVQP
jgi:hypothetical protein